MEDKDVRKEDKVLRSVKKEKEKKRKQKSRKSKTNYELRLPTANCLVHFL
jgi:hypothetical protein